MSRSVYVPREALDVAYVALDEADDYDYDYLIEYYAQAMGLHWPTMRQPYRRTFFDSEGRILAENRLCRIGISTYGNMLALWIVPQEDAPLALAERWALSIGPTFEQYGTHLLIGHASNGEAFFRARENA